MFFLYLNLPTTPSFAGGGSCADNVETWTEELMLVEIIEAGKPVSVRFHLFDSGIEIVGKKIREGSFF